MANHGYVLSRKTFKFEEVNSIIEKACNGKFLKVVEFESWRKGGPENWDKEGWELRCDISGEMFNLPIWIHNKNTLEYRQCYAGLFSQWVQSYIINELALNYKGWIKSEGMEGSWLPVKGKYDNFRKFTIEYLTGNSRAFKLIRLLYRLTIPKELKMFLKK